jgi:hypothetical protein
MHKRTAHGIVEADDGTEIVLGETVFALANATSGSAGSKKVNCLGSNVSSNNIIRKKGPWYLDTICCNYSTIHYRTVLSGAV